MRIAGTAVPQGARGAAEPLLHALCWVRTGRFRYMEYMYT